jgi:hypothetical protein
LRRADNTSKGVLSRDFVSDKIKKLIKRGGQGPIWAVVPLDGWIEVIDHVTQRNMSGNIIHMQGSHEENDCKQSECLTLQCAALGMERERERKRKNGVCCPRRVLFSDEASSLVF